MHHDFSIWCFRKKRLKRRKEKLCNLSDDYYSFNPGHCVPFVRGQPLEKRVSVFAYVLRPIVLRFMSHTEKRGHKFLPLTNKRKISWEVTKSRVQKNGIFLRHIYFTRFDFSLLYLDRVLISVLPTLDIFIGKLEF